jgi:hypothetical protein
VTRSRKHDRGNAAVCRCGAYKFPHRMFAGRCRPQEWVERFFDLSKRECSNCVHLDGVECQVVTGIEQSLHCPEVRDVIRFHGITLFAKARAQLHRSQRENPL